MMKAVPTLLIVDDDDDILALLTRFFRSYNYEVSVAHNGVEMFAALAERLPDLVILDLMMPGEDGLVLCRKLRTGSELPVIMLTAAVTPTDRVVGLELGADDYLTKPFDPRELLARVKAVLRRSKPTRPAGGEMAGEATRKSPGRRLSSATGAWMSRGANSGRRGTPWCRCPAGSSTCCWPSSNVRSG